MVVMFQIVKAMQHIYIYMPIKVQKQMSLKRSTWKIAHPWWGSNPRSLDYISSSIYSCHVSDNQNNASWIYFYMSVAPNQKIVYENDKNMNCRCRMTAILNFTICGKRCHLQLGIRQKWIQHKKIHIETTNEVLFLKNAYRSLSRAIFYFLTWLKQRM